MGEQRAERVEAAVDRIAAALFAFAVGWVAYVFDSFAHVPTWAAAAGAFLIGYGGATSFLRRVRTRQHRFKIAAFEPSALPQFEPVVEELLLTQLTELALTDAERVGPSRPNFPDELVLDDILAEIGPGSRVVRLFDPGAMPTPGQLKSRIDKHLHGAPAPTCSDASQALHEALAELRRSLG